MSEILNSEEPQQIDYLQQLMATTDSYAALAILQHAKEDHRVSLEQAQALIRTASLTNYAGSDPRLTADFNRIYRALASKPSASENRIQVQEETISPQAYEVAGSSLPKNPNDPEKREDVVIVDPHGFVMVADGMGGSIGGQEAAVAVANNMRRSFNALHKQALPPSEQQVEKSFRLGAEDASQEMNAAATAKPDLKDMGATFMGMQLIKEKNQEKLIYAYSGDARLYRLARTNNNQMPYLLLRMTTDQSIVPPNVQTLFDTATTTEEIAGYEDYWRNRQLVEHAITPDSPSVVVDTYIPTPEDEIFFAMSDGPSDNLTIQQMQEIAETGMKEKKDLKWITTSLTTAAYRAATRANEELKQGELDRRKGDDMTVGALRRKNVGS